MSRRAFGKTVFFPSKIRVAFQIVAVVSVRASTWGEAKVSEIDIPDREKEDSAKML
jgi:hypothetical protein